MHQRQNLRAAFLKRLGVSSVDFDLRPFRAALAEINRRESVLREIPDARLASISEDLRARVRNGVPLDALLTDAFALVRETAQRTIGLRPFDVQIMAGMALHRGRLAEMQTGEGKTLAAVLPAFLNALSGRGVHILTFNDYLARRDACWMGPVYERLGLTVGCIQEGQDGADRRAAYACDITYATAKEAGFDFLRDQLRLDAADLVQRAFHFTIVDEADSILIDEARLPLVIAGAVGTADPIPFRLAEVARILKPGRDFVTDEGKRNVHLTDAGLDRAESILGSGPLHDAANFALLIGLNMALHARALLQRDVDYIVRRGRIEIVDEFTGRVVDDRHWPDGLQAAVEAKESLTLGAQGTILGSITLQHYLKLYPKLAGMTATARPAADELKAFYGLDVAVIPPHKPCLRIDHPDAVFTHTEAKHKALIDEISRVHATGRPILMGTRSVKESETLAAALRKSGVPCRVLNARNDEFEAAIIAEAGAPGAVTISTNMAGRGTDIKLGGVKGRAFAAEVDPQAKPGALTRDVNTRLSAAEADPQAKPGAPAAAPAAEREQEREREKVVSLGGLYVIGTNRHESRRIDHQLRGRAGRQGDPGASRFFVSLEDDLVADYGIADLIPAGHRPSPQAAMVDDPIVRREIARGQRIVEGQITEIRKTLWHYSAYIEDQRRRIHARRLDILLDRDERAIVKGRAFSSPLARGLKSTGEYGGNGPPGKPGELTRDVNTRLGAAEADPQTKPGAPAAAPAAAETEAPRAHAKWLARWGEGGLRRLEQRATLIHIDRAWAEYLARINDVRESIHLVRVGGMTPLEEFHRIAAEEFEALDRRIAARVLRTLRAAAAAGPEIDLEAPGLRGPSSTWTYLINDNQFDAVLSMIMGRNIGFAAAAAAGFWNWPFLFLRNRILRRKKPATPPNRGHGPET